MKKEIKIYSLVAIMIFVCSLSVNAQQRQKPSERDFKEEMRKVNEKIAAQRAYINRMKATRPTESYGAPPAAPGLNQASATGANTVPAPPSQSSPNLRPSQQPMRMPQKPIAPRR